MDLTGVKRAAASAFLLVLVLGHKYPKIEGDHLYGGTDTHGCFAIYFFNPCFRVLMAWDKYIAVGRILVHGTVAGSGENTVEARNG